LAPLRVRGRMAVDSGDTAWILTSCALVLFMMLPGLALFYGGLVQSKNVSSIMMQCFVVACTVSVVWAAFGYSLCFSGTHKFIGDWDKAFLVPVKDARSAEHGTIPESVFFLFQMTFAIITPGLFLGAVVERVNFVPMILFSTLWVIFVYCPVCHWVWGGGWMAEKGVRDFAGGLVVHATAGVTAIVLAKLLPPREGFPKLLEGPHSQVMVFTGASMLWVGWFGFNAGSALTADGSAGMAAVVTHLSSATGALTWLTIEGYRTKPTLVAGVTGMVAGLGSITPASGFVGVPGALLMGPIAGCITYLVTEEIKKRGLADDALDVFGVHGVGGLVGTILTAPFSATEMGGVGYDAGTSGGELLGWQLVGCIVTLAWSVFWTLVLYKIIDIRWPFAATLAVQRDGLDVTAHGERAYIIDVEDVKDFHTKAAAAHKAALEDPDLHARRSAPRPASAQAGRAITPKNDPLRPAADAAADPQSTEKQHNSKLAFVECVSEGDDRIGGQNPLDRRMP